MAKRKFAEDELLGAAPTPSLSQRLGAGAISGISAVANALDLPGSMVRDTANAFATGNFKDNNPFDQLLSPLSAKNRTTGRDLNRTLGLASHSDTTPNWWGGLATDVLTDPLTYFTFGGSALGKAGKVLKAAGVHGDEAAKIFAKAMGKAPGTFGKRSARLGFTPEMVKAADPAAWSRVEGVARNMPGGFDLASHMNEPMGGLAKFWPTGTVLGQGKGSQWLAGKADDLLNAVRYAKIPGTTIRPIADLQNMFSAQRFNATARHREQFAKELFWSKERARAGAKGEGYRFARAFHEMGFTDANMDELSRHIQYPQNAPAAMQPMLHELRQLMIDNFPDEAKELGVKLGNHQEYMTAMGSDARFKPRAAAQGMEHKAGRLDASGNPMPMTGFTRQGLPRREWTASVIGGDEKLKEVARYVLELRKNGIALPKDVAVALEAKFGNDFAPSYITGKTFRALQGSKKYRGNATVATAQSMLAAGKKKFRGQQIKIRDTWEDAAKILGSYSDDFLASGVYGNYPINDVANAAVRSREAIDNARHVLQYIVDNAGKNPAFHDPSSGLTTLGMVLSGNKRAGVKGLGLNIGDRSAGAAKWYYKQALGVDLSSMTIKKAKKLIKNFRNMPISKEEASFLTQALEGWGTPKTVKGMLNVYDAINNVTKMLFTSAKPSFHGRNFPSGQGANALAEQFNASSLRDALASATGGPIAGAAEHPLIKQEIARRGLQGVTDEQATKIAHELAAAHEMTGTSGAMTPTHQPQVGGSVNDLLADLPDKRPFSIGSTFGKLLGFGGTTWNPFKAKVRGVLGANQTTFAPGAAGEAVGAFTEHLNRFAPWWNLTKQGVDPTEAARRVMEAQVGYQNRFYTRTEQDLMQRLFLFYKYTKQQIPFTMRLLTEQPGGRLAQALRAINRGRDDEENIPSWIKETTSFPLGESADGTKSYFTGLGLNFEDPLQFAQPNSQNVMMEAASRLNPAIKGPLEWMTGQSFFQKGGPHGGRPLEDLDPVLGRTLANIGNITGLRESKKPVTYPFSQNVEHFLSNSPLSTMLTMARTATDPRKGIGAKSANLLTGLRITDVSPQAQDRELRQKVSQLEKQLGAKVYSDVYLPEEVRNELSPSELVEYERLKALRQLLEARAKARKAQ